MPSDGLENENGGESRSSDGYRCMRCGDEYDEGWRDRLCDPCVKHIQRSKLFDGVPCERCDGHGRVYSSIGDIQRAMNGRDKACSLCYGTGKAAWNPDREEVHPDLRAEVGFS